MESKIINTRVQNKRGTFKEWSQKSKERFIPLDGELIVYYPDSTHSTPCVKIGDGWHTADELPFTADGNVTTWGRFEDLTSKQGVCVGKHSWGEWIADGNYEHHICSMCGHKQIREKNTPYDFEGGTIPHASYKFVTTVGALTGEGDASVNAAAGLTEFGNARDWFSLADDAGNNVLHIVGKNNDNYGASTIKVYNTDALHNANANVDGGQYLVFDFDMKSDAFDGTYVTGPKLFTLNIHEGMGSNLLASFPFYNYGGKLRVGNTNFAVNESGSSSDTWFSFRVVTTLTPDTSTKATTDIYYKVRGVDGGMTFLASATVGSASYGTVTRTSTHYAQFSLGSNEYDYSYYLDNMSFIRTADSNYIYSACTHEFEEIVTPATDISEGVVKRICTVDGCGYVENEIIPMSVDYNTLIAYGPKYVHAAGSIGIDTKLTAGRADIITDKRIIFTADVTSFEGLRLGHGYEDYNASYLEIDNTHVRCYRYLKEIVPLTEVAHGLTITDDIKVTIDVDNRLNATITIYSGAQSFTCSVDRSWGGSNGEIYAESIGSALRNAQVAFTCDGYKEKIQFYGDSYLSQSSDRWLNFAFNDGFTDALFDGYGGRGSGGAYTSLVENLKHSNPEIVVWMMGMNDGQDSDINTPSVTWTVNKDKLIALAIQRGFEIVFTTLPTVPGINHEAKNKWIRESGYRYIDMAEALGADGTGRWTDGYLNLNDNVHPTAAGAEAIYNQVVKDLPEFLELAKN